MEDEASATERASLSASPADRIADAFRSRRRRPSWAVPEIASVALLLMVVFLAAGNLLTFVGFSGSGGVRVLITTWTDWAAQPWLAAMLMFASLLAWYQATRSRDAIVTAGDSGNSGESDSSAESDASDSWEAWHRAQRAHVLAALAGVFGLLTCISVLVLIVVSWPGTSVGGALFDARHFAVVADGLGPVIGAVATVVICWPVHAIWQELLYGEESNAEPDEDHGYGTVPKSPS